MAGITLRDDSAQELKPSRIEKDDSDLSQIKESSMICGVSQRNYILNHRSITEKTS